MPKFLVEIPVRVSDSRTPDKAPAKSTIDFHVDAEDGEEAVDVIAMLLANLIDPDELEEGDGGPADLLS